MSVFNLVFLYRVIFLLFYLYFIVFFIISIGPKAQAQIKPNLDSFVGLNSPIEAQQQPKWSPNSPQSPAWLQAQWQLHASTQRKQLLTHASGPRSWPHLHTTKTPTSQAPTRGRLIPRKVHLQQFALFLLPQWLRHLHGTHYAHVPQPGQAS